MEILEKKELAPLKRRCRTCKAELSLMPYDFEKSVGMVPPHVQYTCPNCGHENVMCPDDVTDKWFNEELWKIIRGEKSYSKKRKIGIFDTIRIFLCRKRFLRVFFRDKETELEIIAGKEAAMEIEA